MTRSGEMDLYPVRRSWLKFSCIQFLETNRAKAGDGEGLVAGGYVESVEKVRKMGKK